MTYAELDRLLCSWPGVTVEIKWGKDRVWMVGGKMFAVALDGTGELGTLAFKVPEEEFLALTEQPGIRPAPYLARARWVQLERAAVWSEGQLRAWLIGAYALVRAKLPRKHREALPPGPAFT